MPDLLDLILNNPAGAAGSTDPMQRLFGRIGTPPFFPEDPRDPNNTFNTGPITPSTLPGPSGIGRAAQENNFGLPSPTSRVPDRQISQAARGEPRSIADTILGRLGGPGRALMPVSSFIGELVDSARNTARQGGLNSIAPNFAAGVRQADQSELSRRLIESQIGLTDAQTEAANRPPGIEPPKPQTDIAKLRQDLENGLISQEVFDARVDDVISQPGRARFDQEQDLRGEFTKETQDIARSKQALSAAGALIQNSDNPISELAAFISTIKSIDNSTVREGELAAFNSMQGFIRNLESQLAKARGEGFTETLRRDIQSTISSLSRPLDELLSKKQEFFRSRANKFGLDPDGVAGSPFATVDTGPSIEVPTMTEEQILTEIERLEAALDANTGGN